MNSTRSHFRLAVAVLGLLAFASVVFAKSDPATNEAAKLLPDNLGSFKAVSAANPMFGSLSPHLFGEGSVTRTYAADDGSRYDLTVRTTDNDSAAFALLTQARLHFKQLGRDWELRFDEPGTANFTNDGQIFFFKGNAFASITPLGNAPVDQAKDLTRKLAEQLDAGEDEIPVLVKHLPQWETMSKSALYCVSLDCLQNTVVTSDQRQAQPVLGVLSFDGGTEAVVANYGQSQLVIVEFTTPQMSIDNDSRIWTKIAELKSQGQPTPSAYRRVGNYSVFVFNAPDDKTANALIDQVKYEQVVQWLGDDPHLYDKLQRYLTQTSAGVLIAVLKSSGLSLVLCLGVGGLLGALLFRHRRAQRATAFSDAGGSIRLNLDQLTAPATSPRLLSGGQRSDHDGH